MLQEEVELWVAARVDCDFKQRQEDVLQHLLEVSQLLFGSVHVTARHKRNELRTHKTITRTATRILVAIRIQYFVAYTTM